MARIRPGTSSRSRPWLWLLKHRRWWRQRIINGQTDQRVTEADEPRVTEQLVNFRATE